MDSWAVTTEASTPAQQLRLPDRDLLLRLRVFVAHSIYYLEKRLQLVWHNFEGGRRLRTSTLFNTLQQSTWTVVEVTGRKVSR